MARNVACLHTAASNIAVFDAACPPGLTLRHAVRPDLLAEADQAGGAGEALLRRTAEVLEMLARDADAVLLTCSSLGGAVAWLSDSTIPVLRTDAALAADSANRGGRVVVLCAASTSLASTEALFREAAIGTQATVTVRLVAEAWPLFQRGALTEYHRCIAQAADFAFAEDVETVALAQASMAGAAAFCGGGLPLTSPAAGLRAIQVAMPQ